MVKIAQLSPQDLELISVLADPVKFAKVHLDWDARWYQANMLRNSAYRKVARCGRRIGKCIAGQSRIMTEDGPIEAEKLASMQNKPAIATFDTSAQQMKLTEDYNIWDNGIKPAFKLTTKTGRVNYVTGNHPFLTIDEKGSLNWIEVDNMLIGDRIAAPTTYEGLFNQSDIEPKKARLLGKLSNQKTVPESVIMAGESTIANFLGAYWDCDGWVSISKSNSVEIGCCSSSELLARDIQHLLLRLGIVSYLKEKKIKHKEETRKAWQVTIHDSKDIKKFSEKINLISRKKDNLKKALLVISKKKIDNNYLYSIPKQVWSYIKDKQKELGLSNMQVCVDEDRKNSSRLRTEYSFSRTKLARYAESLKDDYLHKLLNSNVIWDEIVSIESLGEMETYDLTVGETHTFISDDIISHNTDAICVDMIHKAFTRENARLLVATPYESQVKLIFRRVRELIKKSPEIQASIVRDTKSPEYLEFGNGTTIQGFTAGKFVPVWCELLEVPKAI